MFNNDFFMIVVMWVAGIAVGFGAGSEVSKSATTKKIQADAIEAGVGRYTVDRTGIVTFQWITEYMEIKPLNQPTN